MSDRLKDGLTDLAYDVRVVDLRDRVLKGSRRIAARNRAIGSLAAVAALTGGIMALSTIRPQPPAPPIDSPSPTVSETSPAPSAAPSQSTVVTTPRVDIRNATFLVPAFPGSTQCPARERAFRDGVADVGPGDIGNIELRLGRQVVWADVDGVPGEEALISIACSEYTHPQQVIALKVSPDGIVSPLGYVLNSADTKAFWLHGDESRLRVDGRTVLVDVLGPPRPDGPGVWMDLQTRGYRFEGGSFTQVTGPSQFSKEPDDYRDLDFRNVTLEIFTSSGSVVVKTSNGSGETTIGGKRHTVTVKSAEFAADRPQAMVLYELRDEAGATRQIVNVYETPSAWANFGFMGLASGADGIARIDKVVWKGELAEVTVRTTGGATEIRTYRQATTGTVRWERVS